MSAKQRPRKPRPTASKTLHPSTGEQHLEGQLAHLMREVDASADPAGMLQARIDAELAELVGRIAPHRPERVVELARMACLPWSFGGHVKPDTDGGPTKAELLTLLALVVCTGDDDGSTRREPMNALYREAHEWADAAGSLIHLSQALLAIRARGSEMAEISATMRGREVWVRNSSYPDMVSQTHHLLFDDKTSGYLRSAFGFDAEDAENVLRALHAAQMNATNARWAALDDAVHARPALLARMELGLTSEEHAAFNRYWQPTADVVAFSAPTVALATGAREDVTSAVLNHYSVSTSGRSARETLDDFVAGNNPLRTHPVVRTSRGQFIITHEGLVQPAVRENLEQSMRATPVWETYQATRGSVLEEIGRVAFEKLLPGATTYFAFDYFIPASDAEETLSPENYTKRVEGDILFVLDDIAVIVEAKAVAITPDARAGNTAKLRRNLTDIVGRAADQASRLKRRIVSDGGLRLRRDAWLDLSHIREIHTVALTLEDLTAVALATTALAEAELLDSNEVPWLVSIHDLQIIANLVERPADFLLYLRRRRDPEMPRYYSAVDELDLFLEFYDSGLYVAPDPQVMASELAYVSERDQLDVRLRDEQHPIFVIPRTGALDAWHQSQIDPTAPRSPRPYRTTRPMDRFVDELARRRDVGWLSISATLLAGDTKTQKLWAGVPRQLLSSPRADATGRSYFTDAGNSRAEAWALIWVTRPATTSPADVRARAERYVRDKKYQLNIPRGAVFVFDEQSRRLIDVVYDGGLSARSPERDAATGYLVPLPSLSKLP